MGQTMAAELHVTPSRATNSNGLNLDGAKWFFYRTGTTTPQSVYTTAALSTAHANPVVADAAGKFAPIYFDTSKIYRGVLKTADEATTIYDIDPINAGVMSQLAASGGSALVSFLQAGTGAQSRTVQAKLRDVVSVKDFGAVWDNVADDTAAIQAAIDSTAGPIEVRLPPGTGKITGTIYLRRDGVRIVGAGCAVTNVRYVNTAGGIVFSGDTNTTSSQNEYADCALLDFTVVRSDNDFAAAAKTDPSVVVDLTSFSYSHFNIGAQTVRANACIYYGQGNAGTAPYFNHIETKSGWFGGTDKTQTAIRFRGGAWTGGSSGPNANMIGPVTRAASLSIVADIGVGQGNLFSQISGESIADAFIRLGGNAAVQTGTSTGSNGAITLKDTGKSWATNAYVGGAVKITSGTGSGQVRRIASNSATELKLSSAWAAIPDNTSGYAIYENRCSDNKFINVRQEGSGTSTFIDANPDSVNTEVTQTSVQSVAGYLDDESCSSGNKFFGQSRALIHYSFVNPGASANLNAFPKSSVFGGVKMAGQYVVDWVAVDCTSASHGDTAKVTVDCGGANVGEGTPTFVTSIPAAESTGMAFPVGSRVQQDGLNKSLFLNLQTGAAFSAGVSVNVTVAVSLVG